MQTPLIRNRRGFGVLALIVIFCTLLFIWGIAQHFMTRSIRRRVAFASHSRNLRDQSEILLGQSLSVVEVLANDPGDGEEKFPIDSLGFGLRNLEPGEVFHYTFPTETLGTPSEDPREGSQVRLTAYLRHSIEEESDDANADCAQLAKDLSAFHLKWSQVPG